MLNKFFQWVISHPLLVLLLTVVFMASAGLGLQKLTFTGDYRVFFSADNPQLLAHELMQETYSKSDGVSIFIVPADGKVMTPSLLSNIRKLTDDAWQVPFSTRVDSIANFQYTYSEGDNLIVQDLIPEDMNFSDAEIAKINDIAINEPQLINRLISPTSHVTLVNVSITLPGIDPLSEEPQVAAKVRELKAEFEANNPGVTVYLSGITMMNVAFGESAVADNSKLVPIMFLIVILSIGVLLRTVIGTASLVIIIIISIVCTMGLAGWSGIALTGASASAPIMILTLVVADCVHILTTLLDEMRKGVERKKALLFSLELNIQPLFLTSITTAIGFLSLNFSDSPPFNDLGNMVAAGLILAFLFSITTFPALISLLPIGVNKHKKYESNMMNSIAEFVIARGKSLIIVMLLVVFSFGALVPSNILDDDPVRYFSESNLFRQSADTMEANLSGMTTIEVSIDSKTNSGVNSPQFITDLEKFTQWLRNQPETDHVNSLSDTYKRLNKNMHGDDEQWYRLPEAQDLAAQYLLMYEMSLPYGLDLTNQVNIDKSATRVVGTLKNITSAELRKLEKRLNVWFIDNMPNYEISITSPNIMFAHIAQRNIVSMLLGTLIALILISILLGFALKSVRYCILSLIPNLTPAVIGFGLWALWDGQINVGLSLVMGITLGIVVDDSVHFLTKYLRARASQGQSPEQAVRYAFSSVGRALIITTSVLFLGFMCLAQSEFKLNSDMGLLTAVIILVALIVDFLLLPPLLIKLDKILHPQKTAFTT